MTLCALVPLFEHHNHHVLSTRFRRPWTAHFGAWSMGEKYQSPTKKVIPEWEFGKLSHEISSSCYKQALRLPLYHALDLYYIEYIEYTSTRFSIKTASIYLVHRPRDTYIRGYGGDKRARVTILPVEI